MSAAMATVLLDIEAHPPVFQILPDLEDGPVTNLYLLSWIDPALYDQVGPVSQFERTREFRHPGAAIAWARRQLFHGRVYGDSIELEHRTKRTDARGVEHTSTTKTYDLTLAGFCKWEHPSYSGTSPVRLGAPVKKCKLPQ
jgi:hypothetical protein